LPLLLLVFVLAACGGDTYNYAYTASGDSLNATDLTRTTQFRSSDDINLVVRLNTHEDNVDVEARFYTGSGADRRLFGDALKVTVGEDVGTVVLGLDFDTYYNSNYDPVENPNPTWPSGGWDVEVFVDGEQVETLDFNVGG
jgi:hypothetical protein